MFIRGIGIPLFSTSFGTLPCENGALRCFRGTKEEGAVFEKKPA